MLIQIISHTPVYVWAILALLVYRGTIAMRTREVKVSKMFIIPAIMLALSLQDIIAKFGYSELALGAWAGAAVATMALVLQFGRAKVSRGASAGSVVVAGSAVPMVLMLSVFSLKYAAAVGVAMVPQLRTDVLFSAALCALFGVLNGYFVGRLARDVIACQSFSYAVPMTAAAR
jgi:hypothetical protein